MAKPSADDLWEGEQVAACGPGTTRVFDQLRELAAATYDPPGVRAAVLRWLRSRPQVATELRSLEADPLALGLLVGLATVSRYGLELAEKLAHDFWQIVQDRQFRTVWGRGQMRRHLRNELELSRHGSEAEHAALLRVQRWHDLRIILGDIAETMSFEAITSELADLADVLINAAVELAGERLAQRFGRPACGMSVLGMGKLGGRELNYSSDIDLIFVYAGPGSTSGGDESLDHHAYFTRLGAEVIRILDEPHATGRLYRVDMRLRPEGERGELALSLRATVDYYFTAGRPWERQAMIKARPVGGDVALGQQLLDELRGWVFPKDHHWEDMEGNRLMRRRIEERGNEANIKTGAGGIRDIEFLVQSFQVASGGRYPQLQSRATLPTLRVLADLGMLPRHETSELERHYVWLRAVEHRLQMWEARQMHELPSKPAELLRLARACGFAQADGQAALRAFMLRMQQTRDRVRRLAEQHYLSTTASHDAALSLLTSDTLSPALAKQVLAPFGVRDVQRVGNRLRDLAVEPFFVLSRGRTERALVRLLETLLPLVAESPDPDQTIENFARVIEAVGGRSRFYEMLGSDAALLRQFAELCGWATFIVELLRAHTGLADDIAESPDHEVRDQATLEQEARQLIAGLATPAAPLGYLQARELVRTAFDDLAGADQATIAARLSALARTLLVISFGRCTDDYAGQWGMPIERGVATRAAVLGLGKLGSGEMSYASDLDVVFVSDPGGRTPRKQREGDVFWTRVAQDTMNVLAEGRLYPVDARLRPWGEQGQMVPSTVTLRRYWTEPREVWERMAMTRVAPVAGDAALGAEIAAAIRTAALGAAPASGDAAAVREMRRKLEQSVAGRDHIKRGPGGYVDVEFIAQYLSLGVDPAALTLGSSTTATLRRLAHLGRLPGEAAEELVASLEWLRFIEARMRLTEGKAISSIPTEPMARARLAKRCREADVTQFEERLLKARERARHWFDVLIHD